MLRKMFNVVSDACALVNLFICVLVLATCGAVLVMTAIQAVRGGDRCVCRILESVVIKIKNSNDGTSKVFIDADAAGAWLREIGWPIGLVYAPDYDRLMLAKVMLGSPFTVSELDDAA